MSTYIGDEDSAVDVLPEVLIGREVIDVREGAESVELILDDGAALEIDAGLDCCAYGEVVTKDVIGGKIMSVTTDGERDNGGRADEYADGADSVYKIFLLKNGLPEGTITVNSYEGSGYYGTGYTLNVRKPEEDQ